MQDVRIVVKREDGEDIFALTQSSKQLYIKKGLSVFVMFNSNSQ